MLVNCDCFHFLSPEGFCTIPNRKNHAVVSDLQLLWNLGTFTQHSVTQYICMKKAEFQNLTLKFLLVQGLTLRHYFLRSQSSQALWVSEAAVEDILFDTRKENYTLLYEKQMHSKLGSRVRVEIQKRNEIYAFVLLRKYD